MISAKNFRMIMYGLKTLCNSKSYCMSCPLDFICTGGASISNIEYEDIDKLVDFVEEHE